MKNVSKNQAAAARIRWVGIAVTDPRDAAIIDRYASELEERASQSARRDDVGPQVFWPHPGFAEAQLSMLRTSLKQVFSVDHTTRFEKVLGELEAAEARWRWSREVVAPG